jgi:hypothetical protein
MKRRRVGVLALLFTSVLAGQRAFEEGGDVIYEDAHGVRSNLGKGFSPVVTGDGRVAMLRGRKFLYGDEFDCGRRDARNWVAEYDPVAKSEQVLFDRPIRFDGGSVEFCAFEQMQLSPDGRLLYLVSPVYATSGSLAIVHLHSASVDEVAGVNGAWVIQTGPHRGELIYWRRMWHSIAGEEVGYPYYPLVHANTYGVPIRVLPEECLTCEGADAPILKAYLRKIGGVIRVNGKAFP